MDPAVLRAAQHRRRRLGGALLGSSLAGAALNLCFAGFVSILMLVSIPLAEHADPISSPINEEFHWLWRLAFLPWLPVVLVLLAGIFGYRGVVKSTSFHGAATWFAGLAVVSNLGTFYVNSVLGEAVGGLFVLLQGSTVLLLLIDGVVAVIAIKLWRYTETVLRDAYRQGELGF